MVSQQLVSQWRARLVEWQRRLDEGRPQPWLARAYVRVLSYLLAQYALQIDDNSPVEVTSESSTMRFQAAVPDLSGKAPRTPTQIRSVLEAVQANVPHAEPGPLIDGLSPDDPIVVAAFYRVPEVERLVQMLADEGIEWQTQRFRRKVHVSVRHADLERAKAIVARHAVDACDSPRWRADVVQQFARLGKHAGLLAGFVLSVIFPLPLMIALVISGESAVNSLGIAIGIALYGVTILVPFGYLGGTLWGIFATGRFRRRRKPRR